MAAITPLNATPPLDATLAAVTEVQRLDVEAMHEKVRGILTTTHGGWLCPGAAGQEACRTVVRKRCVLSALGPRICCIMYNTYYIILYINTYYVLVDPV